MKVEFHPQASKEFKAQIRYYEAQRPSLGGEFADEISNRGYWKKRLR